MSKKYKEKSLKAFEIINDILSEYLCYGKYTNTIHDFISSCHKKNMNKFFMFLNLPDFKNLICRHHFSTWNSGLKINKNCNELIFKTPENYDFYFYDTISLNDVINHKSFDRNVFIPIFCNYKDDKHLLAVIIDKQEEMFYFFDVNCNYEIFKNIEENLLNVVVEYNEKFNKRFGFEYINYPKNLTLNKYYEDDNGLCVILTLIIGHCLLLTQLNVNDVFKIFSKLSFEHLTKILKNYSCYYYFCLKKL